MSWLIRFAKSKVQSIKMFLVPIQNNSEHIMSNQANNKTNEINSDKMFNLV